MEQVRIEFVKGDYKNQKSIANVINYITKPEKNPHKITNCHEEDISQVIEEILCVQTYYRKESGKRIRHFYVSFSDKSHFSYSKITKIAFRIVDLFADYQIIFSLHEFDNSGKTCNKHIHFAFNPINYKTGKRIRITKKILSRLHKEIEFIVNHY